MKHCRHSIASILVLFAYLYSIPASATNYQDMWWNPSESGWGVNVLQQSDTLFATWFVYDAVGGTLWLTMAGTASGNGNIFSGAVYKSTGPVFSGPFNPSLVTTTPVGSATFNFTDTTNGILNYTVNGVAVTKSITRFAFRSLPISGTYYGASVGTVSGCSNPVNNRTSAAFATVVVTGDGSTININTYAEEYIAGTLVANVCTSTGTYSQAGSVLQASAITSCSDGTARTVSLEEIRVTENSLAFKSTGQVTFGETCRIVGRFGGVRQ